MTIEVNSSAAVASFSATMFGQGRSGPRTIGWGEAVALERSRLLAGFVLRAGDGRKIYIPDGLGGLPALLNVLVTSLPYDGYRATLRHLDVHLSRTQYETARLLRALDTGELTAPVEWERTLLTLTLCMPAIVEDGFERNRGGLGPMGRPWKSK